MCRCQQVPAGGTLPTISEYRFLLVHKSKEKLVQQPLHDTPFSRSAHLQPCCCVYRQIPSAAWGSGVGEKSLRVFLVPTEEFCGRSYYTALNSRLRETERREAEPCVGVNHER